MIGERRCNCRYGTVEGLKGHQVGCPMLLPPADVARDPRRLAHPVAATCGGEVVLSPAEVEAVALLTGGPPFPTAWAADLQRQGEAITQAADVPMGAQVIPITRPHNINPATDRCVLCGRNDHGRRRVSVCDAKRSVTMAEAGLPPVLMVGTADPRADEFYGRIAGGPLPDDAAPTLGRLFFPDELSLILQPEEMQLIDDCKRAETVGECRTAIDRFLATIYDGLIDDLAAKRLIVTRRLGH